MTNLEKESKTCQMANEAYEWLHYSNSSNSNDRKHYEKNIMLYLRSIFVTFSKEELEKAFTMLENKDF